MKNNRFWGAWMIVFALGFYLAGCSASKDAMVQSPDGSITYQNFYDDLSPYGMWIDYPPYGEVWSPDLGMDFRPYATNGHWLYSNAGWTWASGYPWGWAPFHYGRWVYDDFYGWLWVPGYEWSPAWVTWGFYNNFYCWAPLMPGINVRIAYGGYIPHSIYWNVVDRRHIYDHDLGRALIQRNEVGNIHDHITIINNFNRTSVHNQFYSRGPEINEVEKYTNTHIAPVRFVNVKSRSELNRAESSPTRSESGQVRVYRPIVRHAQPREFRAIDNDKSIRPVEGGTVRRPEADERPVLGQRQEQRDNVRRLPLFRTPENTIPHENPGPRRRR